MTILNETKNLIILYRHICGKSEVPPDFHFWCIISLIAAVVEDKVWLQKFAHEKLFPQLYIFLIGLSGLGKGTAIGNIVRLADNSVAIRRYRGKTTAAHFLDQLGKPQVDDWGRKYLLNPKIWLIMDELKHDLGNIRGLVLEFIDMMTELYTAGNYDVDTGTRKHGGMRIKRPIINWLIGTTHGDIKKILTPDMMDSGFVARCCFIFSEYDFDKRYPEIEYPPDYEEVYNHIRYRLWSLACAEGQMTMTSPAKELERQWYIKRAVPEEELLYSAWKRQHDLMLKFAMILCLADGEGLLIKRLHVVQAINMVERITSYSEQLVKAASETREVRPSNIVAQYLQRKHQVNHTEASRYMRSNRGMSAKSFRNAVFELICEGVVEQVQGTTGGTVYTWLG